MKTTVILVTMGGPASLGEVRGFLFRLFNDPSIIRAPAPIRFLLALLISWRREKTAQEIYKKMGGKSPILENTIAQATALEKELRKNGDYRCLVAMSYSKPFIKDVMEREKNERRIIVPMYPQYSTTTTGSVERELRHDQSLKWIGPFYQNEGFLTALCDNTKETLAKTDKTKALRVLFSAHGLPESIARNDPYPKQCEQTAGSLAQRLNLRCEEWALCYQSRVGPMKWIGPATNDEVVRAARAGQQIIVVPISFVCEHAETLVELQREYRDLATQGGAAHYAVVPTVGTKEAFIQGLAARAQEINQE